MEVAVSRTEGGHNGCVVIVHGTQGFRDRVPGVPGGPNDRSTSLLGSWYATLLRWRPAVARAVYWSGTGPWM